MFVLRLVKAAKIKDVQQFIDKQEDYSIFKKSSNDGKRKPKYVLKWTCTSDKSTLFLDIVEIMVDNKIKLGWEMKFPQTFIICKKDSNHIQNPIQKPPDPTKTKIQKIRKIQKSEIFQIFDD